MLTHGIPTTQSTRKSGANLLRMIDSRLPEASHRKRKENPHQDAEGEGFANHWPNWKTGTMNGRERVPPDAHTEKEKKYCN
jgi:hypothetical protein